MRGGVDEDVSEVDGGHMNMDQIKDILETIYYIAIIILTILTVVYAIKTYLFQTRRSSTLFCKLFIPPNWFGKSPQMVCLEIYNNGNIVAKSIQVLLEAHKLAIIDFIKPNESVYLPIGELHMMLDRNHVYIDDKEISDQDSISIILTVDNQQSIYRLNTSALFARSDVSDNTDFKTTQSIQSISETLSKAFGCGKHGGERGTFRDELRSIANNIRNIKSK